MIILAALWIGLLASPAPCEAAPSFCRCVYPRTPAQGFERADAVLRGVVEEAAPGPAGRPPVRVATVRVVERWKGEVADTVQVQSDLSTCGYHLVVGTEYLIYAQLREGRLFTMACSRTLPIGRAAEDLAALPALAAARPAPGAAPKPRKR